MLLTIITLLVCAALGYAYLREGLFTAFVMCCNLILAGLVAFNFWEPLADLLDSTLANSVLHGYEDVFCLLFLFCVTLGALRTVTNILANAHITLPPIVDRGGGVLFGMLTGYLATGFLLCVFQTMPWHKNFMFFDPSYDSANTFRRVIPPDRVWLAMMFRAGAYTFANKSDTQVTDKDPDASAFEKFYTFDRGGTFEYRYARYRRFGDTDDPTVYNHELDQELRSPGQ